MSGWAPDPRVTVRHNFETAHRLPFLGGKCTNLHGHSWWAEISVAGTPDNRGVLIDFGVLKAALRDWIDHRLDHGAMLGDTDPLVAALADAGCKVFVFGPGEDLCHPRNGSGRPLVWPTVENVAELLRRLTYAQLVGLVGATAADGYRVTVRVRETHVNEATA